MNEPDLFSNIPKLMALFGVLPLLLILLWLSWKVADRSHQVQTKWTRVEAQVVDASQDDTVTLELSWGDRKTRQEVKKEGSFKDLAQSQTLRLYMNPLNHAEMRPDTFGELWGNVVVLGLFELFLVGAMFFLMRTEEPEMPGMSAEFATLMEHAASNPQAFAPAPPPRNEDDGGIIRLREPGESWKANVFWGLLFGLLLFVPALFAPTDVSAWKKYGMMLLGVGWMAFMGRMAVQNYGRTVRCDMTSIHVSNAFGSERILLSTVKKVTRYDLRQKFQDIDNIGRPRYKTRPLDTKAPIILYILRDAQEKELLRLDKNMEPPDELRRFLDRMENLTGPIRDE
jgi:hypothetical protein